MNQGQERGEEVNQTVRGYVSKLAGPEEVKGP